MTPIEIRTLQPEELEKIYEIDRSDEGEKLYRLTDGELETYETPYSFTDSETFWDQNIEEWHRLLETGSDAFGAFDGDRLAGFAIIQEEFEPGISQLKALYVDEQYRLCGIAKSLFLETVEAAKRHGAKQMSVQTIPTKSAVRFYLSQGFKPIALANQAASEDIAMAKAL